MLRARDGGAQLYELVGFKYYGVYLGVLDVYYAAGARQEVHCELAWSSDFKNWHRIEEGHDLVCMLHLPCLSWVIVHVRACTRLRLRLGARGRVWRCVGGGWLWGVSIASALSTAVSPQASSRTILFPSCVFVVGVVFVYRLF